MDKNPFSDPHYGSDLAAPQAKNPFADPDYGKTPERSLARSAGDSAIALTSGVLQGTKMLTDVAGADNAVSRGLGSAADALTNLESPYRKAQKQARAAKIKTAEESGSTWEEVKAHAGAFADAPIDTTLNALGTSVPTIAAAFVPGGQAAAAARGAGLATRALQAGIGAAQGVGNIKGQIHETVKQQHLEAGASEAEAAQRADAAQSYSGDNLGSIVAGGVLGGVAGGTGAEAAVRRLAGRKVASEAAEQAAPGVIRSAVTGVAKEAPMEAIQGGQERLASNLASQGEGFDTPTWQGVAGQAALEGIASAPMGGGFGVAEGVHERGQARARSEADAQARRRAEDAAASADGLTAAQREANQPLLLGNTPPETLYSFPDGSVGRTGEMESYLAGLPEEEREAARARFMGQAFTELNDPQAQQARRWWENYGDGQPAQPRPDYLAEVQQQIAGGTPFTTQDTVETVRNAMEDAWLAQNVESEPGTAADAAPQAADAVGAQLQEQFGQAGDEAALAAVDARVRTGRILSGLQNILDEGAENSVQVLNSLNDGLARINEAPLAADEMGRVRRMADAYFGFKGVNEAAPLPDGSPAAARQVADTFADNAQMEALIPERPSQRMGLDPAAGPLSKAAAQAVDSGASPAAIASLSQPSGVNLGPQADQAQQAAAPPAQARAAQGPIAQVAQENGNGPAIERSAPAAAGATAQAREAGPQARQGPAPVAAAGRDAGPAGAIAAAAGRADVAAARPENWRTSMLRAVPVAKGLGIDHKGKRLAQLVAEIDAAEAQRAGAPQDGADLSAGQIDQEWSAFAPETGTLGVPRADMPQIKAGHRGALVNFLKARGIEARAEEVPANDLKPTQAEFSQAKVDKARSFKGSRRAILVSSDGYVVDGHHQWLAQRANGEAVKVMRLKAPIREVLAQVAEFPSTRASGGAPADQNPIKLESRASVGDGAQTGEASQVTEQGTQQVSDIRDLAAQFEQRFAQAGNDADRTFAQVLGQFAGEIEAGKRDRASFEPALARYREMLATPTQAGTTTQEGSTDGAAARDVRVADDRAAGAGAAAQDGRDQPAAGPADAKPAGGGGGGADPGQPGRGVREDVPGRGDAGEPAAGVAPRAAAADAAEGQPPMFSRSRATQTTYEARIDALFEGEKAVAGTRVLDRSDVMGLLGHPDVPLMLNERHLLDGLTNHPEMTAQNWKKVPQWLENPAAVYTDPKHPGRYTVIAPERIAGYPVMMVVEPSAGSPVSGKAASEQLLVTVFAKTTGNLPALGHLASSGRLKYADSRVVREAWTVGDNPRAEPTTSALQRAQDPRAFPTAGRGAIGNTPAIPRGRHKILTEKNLAGWRRANNPAFSQAAMSPELAAELLKLRRPPATVESVRAAVRGLVGGLGVLPNRLGRVVVATAAEIKQHWEPLIGPVAMEASGDAGKAQGFYDPRTRTVFLIADHIQRGDEVGVVAHELMHKHGPAVLGEDGWNTLHGAIEGWARAAEGSMERRVYDEAAARVRDSSPAGADAQGYSSQELFPYAVQVALELGVRPNMLAKPGTVARWLGQVKAMLRQVWQKIAGGKGDFNSLDLVNLAFGIAQRENPAHAGELDGAVAPLRTAKNFLQARQAAKAFQGKELTNVATGMTAVVSRNSLDKMLSGKAVGKSETPATHSMAVANADSLFERAVLGWSKPDRADDSNIRAVHRFFAPMDVEGRTKLVKLTVKETRQQSDGNPLYTVEAVELNEHMPGKEWIEAAAREDGVSLDNKNPLQRGVGGREGQQADPRPTLAQPRGETPGRSAEDVLSLAQDVERRNTAGDGPQFSRSRAQQVLDAGDAAVAKMDGWLDRGTRTPEGWTAQQKAAASKFATFSPKQPVKSMLRGVNNRLKDRAAQLIFDQFRPLKNISEEAFMTAHLSKATDGALEAVAMHGLPVLRDGAIAVDKQEGGGFLKVLAKLGNAQEANQFLMWVAANRADALSKEWVVRHGDGLVERYKTEAEAREAAKGWPLAKVESASRENLFTPADIAAMKAFNQGLLPNGGSRALAYAQAHRELGRYNKAMLDIAQEAGLINAEARKGWESEFYIPFYRVSEEQGGLDFSAGGTGLARQKVIQQLKGGTENLGDPLANIMANWHMMLTASMRNMAANKALAQGEKIQIAQRVSKPVDQAQGGIWTMQDGKKVQWQVDDRMVLDALEALNFTGYNNPAMRAAGRFKHMLTVGVTISPTFRIRNLTRDILQTLAVADASYNPLKNAVQGWKLTGKDSDTMAQLMAGGGAVRFGSFNDGQQAEYAKRLINMGVKDSQILDTPGKFKNLFRRLYDGYQETGDRAETINRAVVYQRVLAETGSHLQASFAARDLMNFTSMGSSAAIRALAQVLPFFNARLQGMDRLVRGAAADPRRFWSVAGVIGMASALLYFMQGDDEEYKALPDYVRDSYWPVKLGGVWAYIPKPFEVGALGTVVERFTELMLAGDDYKARDFKNTMVGILGNTLAMNPVPQIVKPIGEAWFNYDMFRQQPIDSMAMERLLPAERFNANTSAAAVGIGRALDVSPQKVEHLARGYFGWLGTQALNVGDLMARPFMDMPASPKRDMSSVNNWLVAGDLFKEVGTTPSKYSERFYQVQREINAIYATASQARNLGDMDQYRELMSRPEMKARPLITGANRQMTQINQQMRRVMADRTMSVAQKNEQLQALRARRDAVAQRVDERARERAPA